MALVYNETQICQYLSFKSVPGRFSIPIKFFFFFFQLRGPTTFWGSLSESRPLKSR